MEAPNPMPEGHPAIVRRNSEEKKRKAAQDLSGRTLTFSPQPSGSPVPIEFISTIKGFSSGPQLVKSLDSRVSFSPTPQMLESPIAPSIFVADRSLTNPEARRVLPRRVKLPPVRPPAQPHPVGFFITKDMVASHEVLENNLSKPSSLPRDHFLMDKHGTAKQKLSSARENNEFFDLQKNTFCDLFGLGFFAPLLQSSVIEKIIEEEFTNGKLNFQNTHLTLQHLYTTSQELDFCVRAHLKQFLLKYVDGGEAIKFFLSLSFFLNYLSGEGKKRQAYLFLNKICSIHPQSSLFQMQLAELSIQLGKYKKSAPLLEILVHEKSCVYLYAIVMLASAMYHMEFPSRTIELLGRFEETPPCPYFLSYLGASLTKTGKTAEGAANLKQALEVHPGYPLALVFQCNLVLELQNQPQAEENMLNLLEKYPQSLYIQKCFRKLNKKISGLHENSSGL